jgi:hypothetical protein
MVKDKDRLIKDVKKLVKNKPRNLVELFLIEGMKFLLKKVEDK